MVVIFGADRVTKMYSNRLQISLPFQHVFCLQCTVVCHVAQETGAAHL